MNLESSSGERQRRIGKSRGSANGEGATEATPPRSITCPDCGVGTFSQGACDTCGLSEEAMRDAEAFLEDLAEARRG